MPSTEEWEYQCPKCKYKCWVTLADSRCFTPTCPCSTEMKPTGQKRGGEEPEPPVKPGGTVLTI